jgi:ABC-type dipeptide/oligopeptide/nickel transport systems, permease components
MDEAPRSSELLEAEVEVATRESSTRVRRRGFGIGGWIAAGWMALLVVCSLLAPVLPIADPDVSNASIARQAPSSAALLGGDANGRDVLARVVYGARASLLIGFGAIALGLVIGGALGLLGGYHGHRIDATVAGAFDVMLAVPALILALAFTVFLGPDVRNMILALGIVAIPQLGRITRANTLTWSQREFVLAARAQGARDGRIIVREILPNVLPAMFSVALLGVAVAIVAEGGLSLLGAGVKTGTITWGTMIAAGRADLAVTPWVVLAPATAIFLTVLALNFLGDAIRARFDVREAAL